MMNCLETEDYNFTPEELKNISKYKTYLSVINLENGRGIIVRNGCEILISKPIRERMLSTLHFTYYSWETILKQAQGKIFWPGLRNDLKSKYENCTECQRNKNSKAQAHNEVSKKNMFDNFLRGQRVQVDFAIKGQQNYMSMVCALTGFIKVFKTPNQSTKEAIKCVREWAALYGMPYTIKVDSGPAFRVAFENELNELGVKIIHSSAYHPQSQGLVEHSVHTVKELLDKKGQNLSQLHLNELIYKMNGQENGEKGSATSCFLGRATRASLPNSWSRQIEWRKQIELRGEEIEKQVQRKQRTVGKKLTFDVGEDVLVQNMKTGKWDTKGVITEVRVADDGTVSSYDLIIGDLLTTRH